MTFWSDSDDDEYILPKSKVTRIDHCQNCQSKSYHLFNEVKGELTQKLTFPKQLPTNISRAPTSNSRPPPLPKKHLQKNRQVEQELLEECNLLFLYKQFKVLRANLRRLTVL